MLRSPLPVLLLFIPVFSTLFAQAQQPQKDSVKPVFHQLFQTQSRKITTSAVNEVYSHDLQKTALPSYGGMVTGRLAGLYTIQTTGEPSNDDLSLLVRGQAPLVLVDGTPQSFVSLNPEQIESITVLKDALSTVMLGERSSGGAILITTKKNAPDGKSQLIELTAQQGVQSPTRMPKFLNAYQYSTLYNEALANQGSPALYSQADLDAYKNHTDPYGHPDVDWTKTIMKSSTPYARYDLSFSGQGKTARYFANLDYLMQDGLFRTLDSNKYYNTNANYKRYIFRSNVDLDLSKSFTAALNLFGRIQNTNQPGAGTQTIYSNFLSTPNNAYPVRNANGTLGGNMNFQDNLYGQSVLSGYHPVFEKDFKTDIILKGHLDEIAKGLWVKALVALNAYEQETTDRSKTFAVYKQANDSTYLQYGANGAQNNTLSVSSQNRKTYTEASLGYTRTFSGHTIDAIAMINNDYELVNGNLPFNFTGVAGKISYDYNQKYMVEAAFGYNGAEIYPKDHRYGLFPAIGLGWNIAREDFMKGQSSWLSSLKLRASYGKTGNANAGYYQYYQYYNTGNAYGFGSTIPSSTTTLQVGALANPNISWEKADKFSTGLEGSVLNDRLSFILDYFNDKYYDLLQYRSDVSAIFGTTQPQENIGSNRYSGLEFQATWQNTKGAFHYFISPNISMLKTKVLHVDEPNYKYSWQYAKGRPVNQPTGYVSEGLFQSQSDIASHAYQGGGIVPGDIKYKDLNGDGVIDGNDRTTIGTTKPLVYYGLNTGVSVKGFDLSVLFQGAMNRSLYLTGNGYWGFQGNGEGQAYAEQLNRWTPANAANATYPRLWIGNNTNNMAASSYWMHSGNYMRLKNIELGYSLPATLLRRTSIEMVRIFVNATNLVTFTSLKNVDPEDYTGLYPIMKVLNAGVNIKF